MCKYCVLHGKGKKWFHHVDNFEKTHLDDSERLELARAIYLVTAEASIPGSIFMSKYQLLLAGIHLQTPTQASISTRAGRVRSGHGGNLKNNRYIKN